MMANKAIGIGAWIAPGVFPHHKGLSSDKITPMLGVLASKWRIGRYGFRNLTCRDSMNRAVILLTTMRAELYWITDVPHGRLATMPRPRAGDWLADELASMKSVGIDAVVSLLTVDEIVELALQHEPSICQDIGLAFISYAIDDRGVPSSVDNYLAFIDRLYCYLGDDLGVAIHCRMGIGRSSLVAACLLVKSGLSVPDAFASISRARGIDVPDTKEQIDWVQAIAGRLQNGATAR